MHGPCSQSGGTPSRRWRFAFAGAALVTVAIAVARTSGLVEAVAVPNTPDVPVPSSAPETTSPRRPFSVARSTVLPAAAIPVAADGEEALLPPPRVAQFHAGTVLARLHRGVIPRGVPVIATIKLSDWSGAPLIRGAEISATLNSPTTNPNDVGISADIVEVTGKPGEFEVHVHGQRLTAVDDTALLVTVRDTDSTASDSAVVVRLPFRYGADARLGLPMAEFVEGGVRASIFIVARRPVDVVLKAELLDRAGNTQGTSAAESSLDEGLSLVSLDMAWPRALLEQAEMQLQFTLFSKNEGRMDAIDILERPVQLEEALSNANNPFPLATLD